MRFDYCVVGGGIVGLAVAMSLLDKRPGSSVVVLEKETALAAHQTGHNSGVIHSGIYYTPGSLKAKLCFEGNEALRRFCSANNVSYETPGKLIVATDALEEKRLAMLQTRARENGIMAERISGSDLSTIEPNIRGRGALLVPSTGIVDYKKVCEAMSAVVKRQGGEICLGKEVMSIDEVAGQIEIRLTDEEVLYSAKLVVCAGLQADRLAKLCGLKLDSRIVPFKGEYYTLPGEKSQIVRHLIYPVPDPELPFLGIHLTRMIDGTVTVGPNAVLATAREGYRRGAANFVDTFDTLKYGGFWKFLHSYWKPGVQEMKNSLFIRNYLKLCQKYCPSLELGDLQGYAVGVRAQAIREDGSLVHDFLFAETDRMLHVLNAPSPAATSAIPIGRMIAARLLD